MQNHQILCNHAPIIGTQNQTPCWRQWSRQQLRRLRRDGVLTLITDLFGQFLAAMTIGGMLLADIYLFLSQLAEHGW